MTMILTSFAGHCYNSLHQYSRANHTYNTYCDTNWPNLNFITRSCNPEIYFVPWMEYFATLVFLFSSIQSHTLIPFRHVTFVWHRFTILDLVFSPIWILINSF